MSGRSLSFNCLAVNLYLLIVGPIFTVGTEGFQPIFFGHPAPLLPATAPPIKEERPLPLDTDFRSRVNSLSSLKDFADYFHFHLPHSDPELHNRVGEVDEVALELPQANCIPELTPIPLDLPTQGGLTFFPSCVRVERCGGCCVLSHHLCQPTSVENIPVRTVKVEDNVINRRRRVRDVNSSYLTVKVEKHLACECRCRLQSTECNPAIQRYNEHYCTCDCIDRKKEIACETRDEIHYWDSKSCECLCRKMQSCSSGTVFDHTTCNCR